MVGGGRHRRPSSVVRPLIRWYAFPADLCVCINVYGMYMCTSILVAIHFPNIPLYVNIRSHFGSRVGCVPLVAVTSCLLQQCLSSAIVRHFIEIKRARLELIDNGHDAAH